MKHTKSKNNELLNKKQDLDKRAELASSNGLVPQGKLI